jgi:hypothetical protein
MQQDYGLTIPVYRIAAVPATCERDDATEYHFNRRALSAALAAHGRW